MRFGTGLRGIAALCQAAVLACGLAWGLLSATPAGALDLTGVERIDLTHAYDENTVYWPTSPSGFELEHLSAGHTEGGWYYSANSFCSPEHGGTHLDAPIHFAEGAHTNEAIELERLIAPAVVIDVSEAATADPDHALTLAEVEAFERANGPIAAGSMVLLRTGWDARWPDRKRYLGDDTPGDASNLHFPSFGAEAARFLVEKRGVALIGVDTASIDIGASTDFQVHRIAAARNVPGLENLTGLGKLPATGATVVALPMKIAGGSGGPVRVVALVAGPKR
jgi:kynurenine formamidase